MNEDKIELEEAITILEATIGEFKYLQSTLDEDESIVDEEDLEETKKDNKAIIIAVDLLKEYEEFMNGNKFSAKQLKKFEETRDKYYIHKSVIEEYLAEETEKYKVYKKEVDKNENLRLQLWNHLGRKNMCEKILGIEKTVTLD